MAGGCVPRIGGALEQDPAPVHDRDDVAQPARLLHVVRGEQDRSAAVLDLLDDLVGLHAHECLRSRPVDAAPDGILDPLRVDPAGPALLLGHDAEQQPVGFAGPAWAGLRPLYVTGQATAPVVLLFAADPARSAVKFGPRGEHVYAMQDACAAVCNAMLAATELGLGTCWIAAFDPAAAREVLALPNNVEPIAFTPLGYPAAGPGFKNRKDLSDLVRYESW